MQWDNATVSFYVQCMTAGNGLLFQLIADVLELTAKDETVTCLQASANGRHEAALRSAARALALREVPDLLKEHLRKLKE